MQRPDSATGELYSAPLALRPGSHALSAVTYAPGFERGSRSLSPFTFLVVGKKIPSPLVLPDAPPAASVTFPSAVVVTLTSAVKDTLLYYVLLQVGAEISDQRSVNWILYTQPITVSASTSLAVIQVR